MKAYLFDFDGTLVDSMPTYASVMLRILREQNVPHNEGIIKIITPLGYKGTAEYYKTMGMKISVEECMAERRGEPTTYTEVHRCSELCTGEILAELGMRKQAEGDVVTQDVILDTSIERCAQTGDISTLRLG